MLHRRVTLAVLPFLAGLASCAPSYLLTVQPARPTELFVAGREQAQAFADSVEVRLSFVRYEPTRLVFEAEYRNPTGRPLTVEPAAFTYAPRRAAPLLPGKGRIRVARGATVWASTVAPQPLPALPPTVPAYDPEAEISSLQTIADKAEAKATRTDWLGLALNVATVAVDVASIGSRETPASFQTRAALHDGVMAYNIISATNRVQNAVLADVSRATAAELSSYALRKVTLEPGQQVRGLVFFPRLDTADSLRVLAPLRGGWMPLEFVQTRTRQ